MPCELQSFLQIFSSMPAVLVVPWPSISAVLSAARIFNLDFLSILAQSGCSMNVRFYDKFLLHMMLPIGCLLALVLAYFSGKVCCIKRNDKGAMIHMKRRLPGR